MAKRQISSSAAAVFAVISAALFLAALSCDARTIAGKAERFVVQGRVFCDTCRAGFETPATTYIKGAKVSVECRSSSGARTCNVEGVTDHSGTYNIPVAGEHGDDICEAVLISSPESGCQTVVQGRERARVVLTHNNGISSDTRFANSLGFAKDIPLAGCTQLLKSYEQYEI